ncbi:hypothetical protein DM02DRAFT_710565 [Periconia macrospinosa]|uniref:Atos-like conserved domain-containing protein n=1 Tax=Periconia macrospinosa TaxID=97972 RepID=A0A2V1DQZ8_9PLEO|nr:hypothetical protein DM02DRAFT_710565 [Periconia macrospinosa]
MPIFHDPSESPPRRQVSRHSPSTESRRAWDLQNADNVPGESDVDLTPNQNMDSVNAYLDRKSPMLDRADLIQQLKRANTPTWQHDQNTSRQNHQNSRPTSRDRPQTPVRSPIHMKSSRPSTPDPLRDHAAAGLEIERPRSALHSGDFREKKERTWRGESSTSQAPLATSPVVPWNQSFPAAARPSSRSETAFPFPEPQNYDFQPNTRVRAISQSSLASFAFMPPTSPLVQQSNNTDLDFSSKPGSLQTSPSSDRNNRRHTFSPNSFSAYNPTNMARSASSTLTNGHPRRGVAIPSQAHQPRRSITSLHQFSAHSNPQTPFPGSRQSSFSSDVSPLHHAPMVGSYEESILRGRMSTTPSRPLNFIAKIGVLGKGQCNSNLKCPPHVAVPFPAVFYSYSTGNGRISDDSPSPYVGLIDLENSLAAPDESKESSRRKRRQTASSIGTEDATFQADAELGSRSRTREDIRRREKKKRRSTSPKAPPGGSYRIPQVGQLQIVIKNPNKTAVKLFLVPYDLSDMEPGQKTFVRQRSYSAGPIIDMPLSSRANLGTDRPEAALSNSDDPNDRPILRYLIHLNICCPSKGRYYLYKSIRVVFANRVPDGKEKLRNEIQLPEPRYNTYKATRDSLASQASSSAAAQLTAEKAMRRRSAGFSLSHQRTYDQLDGLAPSHHMPFPPPAVEFTGGPSHSNDFRAPLNAIAPIPFSLSRTPITPPRPLSRAMDLDEKTTFLPRATNDSPTSSNFESPHVSEGNSATAFEKRNVDAFSGATSPGAGLLAKRLRGLDVQRQCEEDGST